MNKPEQHAWVVYVNGRALVRRDDELADEFRDRVHDAMLDGVLANVSPCTLQGIELPLATGISPSDFLDPCRHGHDAAEYVGLFERWRYCRKCDKRLVENGDG
ncbi:MAG: hypothetical protein IT285_16125 [Bdellovibrionales bacterium]|nr:hypothetical protein [Bdellovibrionales bacterium]